MCAWNLLCIGNVQVVKKLKYPATTRHQISCYSLKHYVSRSLLFISYKMLIRKIPMYVRRYVIQNLIVKVDQNGGNRLQNRYWRHGIAVFSVPGIQQSNVCATSRQIVSKQLKFRRQDVGRDRSIPVLLAKEYLLRGKFFEAFGNTPCLLSYLHEKRTFSRRYDYPYVFTVGTMYVVRT